MNDQTMAKKSTYAGSTHTKKMVFKIYPLTKITIHTVQKTNAVLTVKNCFCMQRFSSGYLRVANKLFAHTLNTFKTLEILSKLFVSVIKYNSTKLWTKRIMILLELESFSF